MNIAAIDNFFLKSEISSIERPEKNDSSFSNWLIQQVSDTNEQLNNADLALNELALGKAENLHQTMLTLEQAKLSFQYLEQIRNRLMNAYQDLLREQI